MFRFLFLLITLAGVFSHPVAAAINAPSGLTGSWTPAAFSLSWTDNSSNESGFYVTYRIGTTGNFSRLSGADVGANVRSYSIANLPADGCLDVQWAIYAFAGPAGSHTDLSGSSNIITLRSPPEIVSPATYASPLGQPFSYYIRLQACDAANAPTGYNATNLPAGLTVNTATGHISGTPTGPAGNSVINVSANYGTPVKTVNSTVSVRLYQFQPRAAQGPVAQSIPAQTFQRGAAASSFTLGTWFSDPDATSAVRIATSLGNMDFGFFGTAAPLTVANFMNYVNRGDFVNSIFHRSVPGFVIQGGGFRATTPASAVPTDPPVQNEFNPANSNLGGTISMAKLGGDPNSATCQFFVSLDNNAANLDSQNGGFTVFGRVAGSGMDTAFAIARQPIRDWSAAPGHSALTDVPVSTHTAGDAYDATQLVTVSSVTSIPPLTWLAVSSDPSICSASVNTGTLTLTPGNTAGTATVTLTATDLDNLTVQQTMTVTVEENLATWLAVQNFPNPGDATALANPDGDTLPNIMEFALMTNPQAHSPDIPAGTTALASEEFLTLTFPIRKFTGSGFRYAVESHNALTGEWTEVWKSSDGFAHAQVVSSADLPDRTNVVIRDTTPITAGGKHFLRLRVTDTP